MPYAAFFVVIDSRTLCHQTEIETNLGPFDASPRTINIHQPDIMVLPSNASKRVKLADYVNSSNLPSPLPD